jgi:hypothetical protein
MPVRLTLAGTLGAAAAVLASCGGSSGKLIPVANAEPLKRDFQEVLEAAQAAGGDCANTEAALAKTEQDYGALPASVDSGLRRTLQSGIANLRRDALALCAQPLTETTATSTTPKTTSTQTTPTETTTTTSTPTTTATTTPTTSTPTSTTSPPGGGTPAPGETPSGQGGKGGGTGAGEGGGSESGK